MNEAEWNASSDPPALLRLLREAGNTSDRKLRLFAVACCRRVLLPLAAILLEAVEKKEWGLYCTALGVAEKLAEGQAGESELLKVRTFARSREQNAYYLWGAVAGALDVAVSPSSVAWKARVAALHESIFNEDGRYDGTEDDPEFDAFLASEKAAQVGLLRDIVGLLPFREVQIEPSLLTKYDGLVRKLAQASYDHRDLPSGTLDAARLVVLADALEEAGYADAEVLRHLRSEGPHVRGCFALDAILGKS